MLNYLLIIYKFIIVRFIGPKPIIIEPYFLVDLNLKENQNASIGVYAEISISYLYFFSFFDCIGGSDSLYPRRSFKSYLSIQSPDGK
jgi:hypothetical protein